MKVDQSRGQSGDSSGSLTLCRLAVLVACSFTGLGLAGCADEPQFRMNSVYKLTIEKSQQKGEPISDERIQQIGVVLTALFGTPADPQFPKSHSDLIDQALLVKAAGPVASNRDGSPQGLYREHCVHCHGITGDGSGPTSAFLNPYPRDFRMGKFKFKSTKIKRPPTDHDLRRILQRGIAGTAMPSFATLSDDELDALIEYVKYLSIRGQTERQLMSIISDFDEDPLTSPKDSVDDEEYSIQMDIIMEEFDGIAEKWANPEQHIIKVPTPPKQFSNNRPGAADAGKILFYGKAGCVQCHGETGVGDGQTEKYDEWTADWADKVMIDAGDKEKIKPFLDAGALKPRKLRPRNLRHQVFRGGSLPEDLFRRIRGGIEGSNMPNQPTSLSDDEVWFLVAYVQELPFMEQEEEGQ